MFGVPGNPVASMVCFELYVRPALLALQGRPDMYRPWLRAAALEPVRRTRERTEARRCRLEHDDGRWSFTTTGPQGSAILRSMALAQGLALVPAGYPGGEPGASFVVQLAGHRRRTAALPPLRRRGAAATVVPRSRYCARVSRAQRQRVVQLAPHDQAVAGAVGRRAGGEHQGVAAVGEHAHVGGHHRRLLGHA